MDLLDKIVILEEEASKFGFRWENTSQIMNQIQSECLEINAHLHKGLEQANTVELQEEIGDLLHAAFSLCVFCNLSPRDTLNKTVSKFERRFNAVKSITEENGLACLDGRSFDELMDVWDKAKERVG